MAHHLEKYDLGWRLAILRRDHSLLEGHENLVHEDGRYFFSSDEKVLFLTSKMKAVFDNYHHGDIININEAGKCLRLFDSSDGEATIFMGGNCNSNCIMCPSSDFERKQDYSETDEITGEFIEMLSVNLSHYVLTGGEPTIKTRFFLKAMGRLADRFPRAEALLLTNGRSFSSVLLLQELLMHCPPFLTVAIPIHGAEASIHDSISRSKGSFEQTLRGIENLLGAGISIEIRIVVSLLNCNNLMEIAQMIVKKFPDTLRVNFISLEVRGNCARNKDQVYIDPEASFIKSRGAINHLIENGIAVGLYNYPLCCVDKGYWTICHRSISGYKVRYEEKCNSCSLKTECGGLFVTTMRAAHPEIHPILL